MLQFYKALRLVRRLRQRIGSVDLAWFQNSVMGDQLWWATFIHPHVSSEGLQQQIEIKSRVCSQLPWKHKSKTKVMRGLCLQDSDRLPKMPRRLGCSFLIACLTSLVLQYCLCVCAFFVVVFFWFLAYSVIWRVCVRVSIVLHLIASDNPLYLRASSWYRSGLKQNNRKIHEIR